MTLSERIAANECAVRDCHEPRLPDAVVCRQHLNDLWQHRLIRIGNEYAESRLAPRDETGWTRAA